MLDIHKLKEQIFQQINWIRSRPQEVAEVLISERRPMYQGVHFHLPYGKVVKTMEGIQPVEELITQLEMSPSVDPLQRSFGLQRAAEVHANELGSTGHVSHKDPRNQQLPDRLRPYCTVRGKAVQLIELSGVDSRQILFELLVDDGLASRSRRRVILNPLYRHIGIGISRHKMYGHITVLILTEDCSNIQYQFTQPPAIVVPQFVRQPVHVQPSHQPVYVVEDIMSQEVMQPLSPYVIQNISSNRNIPHSMQTTPSIMVQNTSIHQSYTPNSMQMTLPPLQPIQQVYESNHLSESIVYTGINHVPVPIYSQSLSVQQDVNRNRLLFARTYNKDLFGGDNTQGCQLF